MTVDIFNTDKKYGIVYTDPPWPQTKSNPMKVRPHQGKKLDYDTMDLDSIKTLHRDFFIHNTAEKHNVFMWAIDKFLPQTEQFMKELGYALHARMIWDKGNGVAPAFTVRFAHEYLLWFYKRGGVVDAKRRGTRTLHDRSPREIHEAFCKAAGCV